VTVGAVIGVVEQGGGPDVGRRLVVDPEVGGRTVGEMVDPQRVLEARRVYEPDG